MKKLFVVLPLIMSLLFALPVSAADEFDPVYYAANNPDVVAVYGNTPEDLYRHYVEYGKNEGRPANASQSTQVLAQQMTGKYVDVDKSTQTVTLFVDGVAVMSSPCVTGNVKAGHDTPNGTYSIKFTKKGKTLKGPTWNVWVDYWMRFTDGAIGFHDASWRDSFGGDIYKTNGSHGCVNLPKNFAKELFNNVEVGTTVIVH